MNGEGTSPADLAAMRAAAGARQTRLIGHHDLGGQGDAMQVVKRGDLVYVAHVGASPLALSILDCRDPANPRLIRQLEHPPNTHRHKVQVVGDVLVQNSEVPYFGDPGADPAPVTGLCIFHLDDPTDPRPIGFYPVPGEGVHRIWYTEAPYAHIAGWLPGVDARAYHIVDLSDPARPLLAGSWWIPGTRLGDEQPWPAFGSHTLVNTAGHTINTIGVHGVIPHRGRGYAACLDAGFALLDISDVREPKLLGRVNWHPPFGGFHHTALPLPGRGLVVATCESIRPTLEEDGDKRIWLIDVRCEQQPVMIGSFPRPEPPEGSPWRTFWERPLVFGPHNVHENRPGSFVSETLIFSTWNNAGLRIHDVSDADRPTEVGHFMPEPPPGQEAPAANDLFIDPQGIIYLTDRRKGGLYVLEYTGPLN